MNRTEFIKRGLTMLAFGIPLIGLANSCTSENEPSPTPPNTDPKDCQANGTTTSIGSNHGHDLTVSKADVDAAIEKSYSIQGTSGHNHGVTITATNFTALKSNQSIQVTSTSGSGHTHSVTVGCA